MNLNFTPANLFTVIFVCFLSKANAQNFTSFFTGNTTNIETTPTAGICLMGGASEDDNAMAWFLERANGGDVLVLRTSGGDGYNNYFYSQLGVTINSVETLLLHNAAAASDPYVLNKIENAEAIWFAGGNQATYVTFLQNSPAMDLLNDHINVKQAPIGGISAGMAIMGEFYFDAINGSVNSTQAMNNPFASSVSIGQGSFLDNPILQQTITDTHFDNPNRKGRLTTFLARIVEETGERAFGIAADEFVAICIDEEGIAKVFGAFPQFDDIAYFVQVNCLDDFTPEVLQPNTSLTWNRSNEALKVYRVPGNSNGSNTFDLNTWEEGTGGTWENWWVNNANFSSQSSTPIDCETLSVEYFDAPQIAIFPNPTTKFVHWEGIDFSIERASIYSANGKLILSSKPNTNFMDVESLPNGMYFLKLTSLDYEETFSFIKR